MCSGVVLIKNLSLNYEKYKGIYWIKWLYIYERNLNKLLISIEKNRLKKISKFKNKKITKISYEYDAIRISLPQTEAYLSHCN